MLQCPPTPSVHSPSETPTMTHFLWGHPGLVRGVTGAREGGVQHRLQASHKLALKAHSKSSILMINSSIKLGSTILLNWWGKQLPRSHSINRGVINTQLKVIWVHVLLILTIHRIDYLDGVDFGVILMLGFLQMAVAYFSSSTDMQTQQSRRWISIDSNRFGFIQIKSQHHHRRDPLV